MQDRLGLAFGSSRGAWQLLSGGWEGGIRLGSVNGGAGYGCCETDGGCRPCTSDVCRSRANDL